MSDASDRPASTASEGDARLSKLNRQVAAMRAVLVGLLQEVVVTEARLDRAQANLLQEANEQLIVSALDAQMEAESAHGALDEAARAAGLDALTGLPNRAVLLDHLELAVSMAKRHARRVAVLFLDVDSFKQINDTLGHAAGDEALKLVANCLSSVVRENDTVSRQGGDEFVVLLAEVKNAGDAQAVAAKVNAALARCSRLENRQLPLKVSIGISVYPENGEDARALLAFADAAMYAAKRNCREEAALPRDASGELRAQTVDRSPSRQHPGARHTTLVEQEARHQELRDANENLILAALGAQELLAAAREARRRQSELLVMVASELSDPFAPIRLAASSLGIAGAEAALLPRVQRIVEEQAQRLERMVRELLEQQDRDLM
ncbi:hypothetical protein CKO44_06770 [Rubrivivax gelatinosus]|nr:hypothetical protein [Rubrivivax gelatinosus]